MPENIPEKASVSDVIVAYESGDLDDVETVAMFQRLIDDGSSWRLQGCYGRAAMDLIRCGQCVLGPVGHRDYFGNYVPSRHEVEAGTPGSLEFATNRKA